MLRPTYLEIDIGALKKNFEMLKGLVGNEVKILAVVKADAYGHGATMVSRTLEQIGVDFLGVAICEEGIALRNAGINVPILILSGIYKGQAHCALKYNLSPVIYNLQQAEELSKAALLRGEKCKVHLKVDTGMGRIGILAHELKSFLTQLKKFKFKNLHLEGVISHFATSEEVDKHSRKFTALQLKTFKKMIKEIEEMGFYPKYRHIASSGAILQGKESWFNMVRPGLMIYGVSPSHGLEGKADMLPVMSLKSQVAHLKRVPKNFSVSYGRSFITKRDSIIATVPLGYGDGFPRGLSNKGNVLIKGKRAPIVGAICMDWLMVDVTDIDNVSLGDEVVLLGKQNGEKIKVEEIAHLIDTNAYEVLCSSGKRLHKVYKNGERLFQ